jgi:hypothetical protein
MIVKKELFPGRTVTQLDVDGIITRDLSKLSLNEVVHLMSLSVRVKVRVISGESSRANPYPIH